MLSPQQLHRSCDPAQFSFQTTRELECLGGILGQSRALDAMRFGADMAHDGYNIFVLGPTGVGKHSMARQFLEAKAHSEPPPIDWCYVNNFDQPHKPLAIRLPAGYGAELKQQMSRLLDYLRGALPAAFESDDYRAKSNAILEEFSSRQDQAFKALGDEALQHQIVLLRTAHGFAFAPTRNQEVVPADEFAKLPEEERERIGKAMAQLQVQLEQLLSRIPRWWKERSERLKQLNQDTALLTVGHVIDEVRKHFAELPAIQSYLDSVQQDMVQHADDFLKSEEGANASAVQITMGDIFHRYKINVLVGNGEHAGAPIICEDSPSYGNLLGRVEHVAQLGALVTDFTLIKPGALHRANGGYLMLDSHKLLTQPFAWEGLKRALQSHEIRIESLGQMFSLVSTVSLEPEPIPLKVKIVLFGERLLFYLLQQYDPDFSELFKVAADFEERIDRSAENHLLYARLIATLVAKQDLLPFDRSAVARVIDRSARLVGDAERLSIHMRSVTDLLQEADYWARQGASEAVSASHVQQAIDTQIHRADRLRDQLYESIQRGTLLIDTQGAVIGQVNALAAIDLGHFAFAQPTRITATSRLGDGEMINIEREVKLSGAIHSKGVLILSSFLATRYARNQPLALAASLVFEQSYGAVDGDSASMAELCVLLSDLAQVPILQSLAITGSVNQLGQAQAIGAVNEKIEGFFDVCRARGLTGQQGVLIPGANVKHLMLRHDVVAAAEAGQFHIHAVDDVDQAIALLTGVAAGETDSTGQYPVGSINQRVMARVAELNQLRKAFGSPSRDKSSLTDAVS